MVHTTRSTQLFRVLVFSFFRQNYGYLYSLRSLMCLFWWIDLLRCMLLRLFPFFSLMLPLYVNMQGSLSKEFCIPITRLLVSTWTSSLPFWVQTYSHWSWGLTSLWSRLPQIKHLPQADRDVEPFVSYQYNHLVFLDSVSTFLPGRFLSPALGLPVTWLRFLYSTSALKVSYQSQHEEWICRLVESQARTRSTRSHQVLLRVCCVPVMDWFFPPIHLRSGSTGTSYNVELHLTWESLQTPLTWNGVHCQRAVLSDFQKEQKPRWTQR